jgi:NAD(P)H-dependent flavin oxidoreductase YrpB (nitropropane dioxygenase family)
MNDRLHTRLCSLLGIQYPIVQTGMGWVSGARLTAATSEAGGLGILGSATMTVEELEAAILRVKQRTKKPFGVNLRSDQPDVIDRAKLMMREGVKVASFAQAPNKDLIRRFKDAGIVTMPTIGARRHAEKVASWGVDAVIAQGHEGGGHTGPVATTLLLPQVCDAVDIPVVGAGGFSDGRGLVAAMAYGASGIAMGTRFLLTQESHVPDAVKQRYLKSSVTDTIVTRAIDGYPQRVILTDVIKKLEQSNQVMRLVGAVQYALAFKKVTGARFFDLAREGLAMKGSQELTWAQVSMAATAPMMTKASMVDGRADVGILPTGQVVGVIEELPTVAELVQRIMREAHATLQGLTDAKGKAA